MKYLLHICVFLALAFHESYGEQKKILIMPVFAASHIGSMIQIAQALS